MDTIPVGPTTQGSTNLKSNYSQILECDKLIFNQITDGISTIGNGTITNLNDPVNPQDIATKNYADSKLKIVAEPLHSVQYNKNDNFAGSVNLTFDKDTSTLFSTKTQVGSVDNVIIENGIISNVPEPISFTTIVSKEHVDRYRVMNVYESSVPNETYSANVLINGIIIKTTGSQDALPSALDIVNEMKNVYNPVNIDASTALPTNDEDFNICSCECIIKNVSTDPVEITPGTDVNVYPHPQTSTIVIHPGYTLEAYIQARADNIVNFMVKNLSYIALNENQYNFLTGPRSMYHQAGYISVTDKFTVDTQIQKFTSQNKSYSAKDLVGIIHREFEGPKIDTFSDAKLFIQSYSYYNSPIYNIFRSGSIEVTIKNTSTTGSLTLVGNDDWYMDPNSNMVIPAGKTGMFYVYIDTINVSGHVYTIGIF